MLPRDFIGSLACPYCRSPLRLELDAAPDEPYLSHGVVDCACYSYPIVDGILVLRQLSGPADTYEQGVEHVRRGDIAGARAFLEVAGSMLPGDRDAAVGLRSAVRRATRSTRERLFGRGGRPTQVGNRPIAAALRHGRPAAFADYLYQRYANPSFLAAVPTMALIDAAVDDDPHAAPPVVLDLGCGIGHSTAMIGALYPDARIIAADPDFVNLQILRRHLNPAAICVCVDAELPLPFADDAFDALFCLDAFHYIRSKWALCRELDRVLRETGVWILPHLHNADIPNISPGIPLAPKDYLRMLDGVPGVLLDEAAVLHEFIGRHVLDLSCAPTVAELADTPNMTMCASRRAQISDTFDLRRRVEALAQGAVLGMNPIYRKVAGGGHVGLVMEWPSATLERECSAVLDVLPRDVSIEEEIWRQIESSGDRRGDAIVELLLQFVIIPLPVGYRLQPNGSAPR